MNVNELRSRLASPLAWAVLLALAGSFLLPSEWFLLLNPAHSEIQDLEASESRLKADLGEKLERRRKIERDVGLRQAELNSRQDTVDSLVRRQVRSKVESPFGKNIAVHSVIEDLKRGGASSTTASKEGIRKSAAASEFLLERIEKTRTILKTMEEEHEGISSAMKNSDRAEQVLNSARLKLEQTKIEIASIEEEIRVVGARGREIRRQSTNQYLAMRAIVLGALGAFAAALAAFLRRESRGARLEQGRTMLSMLFGGIISLVVFALFTTREISVFGYDGAAPNEMPEYWRVVILCLVSGAFADRLFAAARERVEQATQGGN